MHEKTGGAFDISVGALYACWLDEDRRLRHPSEDEIEQAHVLTGMKHLEIDDEDFCAKVLTEGVQFDLGGIGKGFAAEKVAPPPPSREADDALDVDRTVFAGNLPVRRSDVTAKLLADAPARDDPTVDATARLLSDLDACMQFEEAYYEGDAADDDAKIISAAPAPAAARLDQDVFKKIFSFWEPLGHEMWLDLARDSVHLDRFCRASNICKRMLIPHVEYD